MKIKVIETKETILELPDNHFEDKDGDYFDELSDCEIAHKFKTHGKKLSEWTSFEDISWEVDDR